MPRSSYDSERRESEKPSLLLVGFDGFVERPETAAQRKNNAAAAHLRRMKIQRAEERRAAIERRREGLTIPTPSPIVPSSSARPVPSRADLMAAALRQQAVETEAKLKESIRALVAEEKANPPTISNGRTARPKLPSPLLATVPSTPSRRWSSSRFEPRNVLL